MLLQSDREQSGLLKWDPRAGRGLRAHTNLTALSWPVRGAPSPGDVVVCSWAPDPTLPCNSVPRPDQPKPLQGEPKSGSEVKQTNQFSSLLPHSINFKSGTYHVIKCRARQGRVAKGPKIRKISPLFSRNLVSAQGGKTHMQGTRRWSIRSKARPVGRGTGPAGGNRMEGWQRQRNGHKCEQQRTMGWT